MLTHNPREWERAHQHERRSLDALVAHCRAVDCHEARVVVDTYKTKTHAGLYDALRALREWAQS